MDRPTGGLFVSYRRSDTAGEAGWLADRLARRFGRSRVFFDREPESLGVGDRWAEELDARVRSADVVLVVIGPDWLVPGPDGQPRLASSQDWVRREIETALATEARVVPTLVGDAPMPSRAVLDDLGLSELRDLQRFELRTAAFRRDADALADELTEYVGDDRGTVRRILDRTGHPAMTVAAAMVGAVVTSALAWRILVPDPTPSRMDGEVNLAVAAFDVSALDDTSLDQIQAGEDVGESIAAATAGALRRRAGDGDDVWGPGRVGRIEGDPGRRTTEALALGRSIGADVVLHGALDNPSGGRARLVLDLTVVGIDQRRPIEPGVLSETVGEFGPLDARRIDRADEAEEAIPALADLNPLFDVVRWLDRDRPVRALGIVEQLRSSTTNTDPRLLSVIDALAGVAHVRRAEGGVEGELDAAIAAFTRALEQNPALEYARLWLLGTDYLVAVGGTPDALYERSSLDRPALAVLQQDLTDFLADTELVYSRLQARLLHGQVDLVLALAVDPGAERERRLDDASDAFEEIVSVAASRRDLHELDLTVRGARSNLGLIAATQGRLDDALDHYESARDGAAGLLWAQETAKIGVILATLDQPCAAVEEFDAALASTGDDGPHLTDRSRDELASFREQAVTSCESG